MQSPDAAAHAFKKRTYDQIVTIVSVRSSGGDRNATLPRDTFIWGIWPHVGSALFCASQGGVGRTADVNPQSRSRAYTGGMAKAQESRRSRPNSLSPCPDPHRIMMRSLRRLPPWRAAFWRLGGYSLIFDGRWFRLPLKIAPKTTLMCASY